MLILLATPDWACSDKFIRCMKRPQDRTVILEDFKKIVFDNALNILTVYHIDDRGTGTLESLIPADALIAADFVVGIEANSTDWQIIKDVPSMRQSFLDMWSNFLIEEENIKNHAAEVLRKKQEMEATVLANIKPKI